MKTEVSDSKFRRIISIVIIVLFVLNFFTTIMIFCFTRNKINIIEDKTHNLSGDVSKVRNMVDESPCRSNILHEYDIQGTILKFYDSVWSVTSDIVAGELKNNPEYNFENIDFQDGDVVIDIGGNIGMISIFLAKKYPFLKIYAFEPVKQNYENFLKNIEINDIPEGIITVENKAVTGDRRDIAMSICYHNMGGSRVSQEPLVNDSTIVTSVTLQDIFERHKIKSLKLLKIDCEGSEYEILYNAPSRILSDIRHIQGEFHNCMKDKEMNCPEKLIEFCKNYVPEENIIVNIV